jgi:drug/metabolite transporter (DMT)-like permease
MGRVLTEYMLVLATAVGLVASQLLLKLGLKGGEALSVASLAQFGTLIRQILTTPALLIGYSLGAITALLWLILLSRLELSYAALILTGTYYILLMVVSASVLREAVTPWRWAGMLLILAGVALISKSL